MDIAACCSWPEAMTEPKMVGPLVILFGRTRVKTLWAGGVLRATREQEAARCKPEDNK